MCKFTDSPRQCFRVRLVWTACLVMWDFSRCSRGNRRMLICLQHCNTDHTFVVVVVDVWMWRCPPFQGHGLSQAALHMQELFQRIGKEESICQDIWHQVSVLNSFQYSAVKTHFCWYQKSIGVWYSAICKTRLSLFMWTAPAYSSSL